MKNIPYHRLTCFASINNSDNLRNLFLLLGESAIFSWVASGYKVKPKHFSTVRFDYYKNFAKVKKDFMKALKNPDVNFIMFHMEDIVDRFGHFNGPQSQEVNKIG